EDVHRSERLHRLAHGRPADPERLAQRALRRQTLSGGEPAAADLLLDRGGRAGRRTPAREWRERLVSVVLHDRGTLVDRGRPGHGIASIRTILYVADSPAQRSAARLA